MTKTLAWSLAVLFIMITVIAVTVKYAVPDIEAKVVENKNNVTSINQQGGITTSEVTIPEKVIPVKPESKPLPPITDNDVMQLLQTAATIKRLTGTYEERKLELLEKLKEDLKDVTDPLREIFQKRADLVTRLAKERELIASCFAPDLTKEDKKKCSGSLWAVDGNGNILVEQ